MDTFAERLAAIQSEMARAIEASELAAIEARLQVRRADELLDKVEALRWARRDN
jgi:hypothetical protein